MQDGGAKRNANSTGPKRQRLTCNENSVLCVCCFCCVVSVVNGVVSVSLFHCFFFPPEDDIVQVRFSLLLICMYQSGCDLKHVL